MATKIIKRVVATSLEILAEMILWGCLVGALTANMGERLLYMVLGTILALPVVLFLHGYYFTRVFAGLVLRSSRQWTYPVIASTIFGIHMYVAFARLKPDMSAEGKTLGLPFITAGACIVFLCALAGNRLLQKWTVTTSKSPSLQPSGVPDADILH